MALAPSLYAVAAYGHADLILAVGVGVDVARAALDHGAVDLERHAVHGDVGAEVGHLSAQGERRLVAEVDVVQRQRAGAYEAVARHGRELMDALRGYEAVAAAAAHKRYAADGVLAVFVGHAVARQLVVGRHYLRRRDVRAHRGVATVGQVVGIAVVIDQAVLALVHGPVEGEAALATAQHAVVIARLLFLGQRMVPHAHLGKVALEGIQCV